MELRHAQTYRVPRGRRSDPPFAQSSPTPSSDWPAGAMMSPRRLRFAARRRTDLLDLGAWGIQTATVPPVARRRPSCPRPRRGDRFDPPWPQQAAAPPPPYPPQSLRVRVRPALLRRGHAWSPPWPQQTPAAAPLYPPQNIRARVRPATARRGRTSAPPWDADTPLVVRRPRAAAPAARRARRSLWFPLAAPIASVAAIALRLFGRDHPAVSMAPSDHPAVQMRTFDHPAEADRPRED